MARFAALVALVAIAVASTDAAVNCPAFTNTAQVNVDTCVRWGCQWIATYPHCIPRDASRTLKEEVNCPAFTNTAQVNVDTCVRWGCQWIATYPHCIPRDASRTLRQ